LTCQDGNKGRKRSVSASQKKKVQHQERSLSKESNRERSDFHKLTKNRVERHQTQPLHNIITRQQRKTKRRAKAETNNKPTRSSHHPAHTLAAFVYALLLEHLDRLSHL
jgi:hypothetical protein